MAAGIHRFAPERYAIHVLMACGSACRDSNSGAYYAAYKKRKKRIR